MFWYETLQNFKMAAKNWKSNRKFLKLVQVPFLVQFLSMQAKNDHPKIWHDSPLKEEKGNIGIYTPMFSQFLMRHYQLMLREKKKEGTSVDSVRQQHRYSSVIVVLKKEKSITKILNPPRETFVAILN